MAAYFLLNSVSVKDPELMEEYHVGVFETIQHFGGECVVLGGPVIVVEGSPRLQAPQMLRFPSLRLAREWYDSPEYSALLVKRKLAGIFDAVFLEGID